MGSYVASIVLRNLARGNIFVWEGLDPVDAGVWTAAGALSGGLGGLTRAEAVLMNAIIGFDTTLTLMAIHGQLGDPFNLILGTITGGIGGLFNLGQGVSAFVRGSIAGGFADVMADLIGGARQALQELFGAGKSRVLAPQLGGLAH